MMAGKTGRVRGVRRAQPKLHGNRKRYRLGGAAYREVRQAVEREAAHFGVSMSWVLVVAAADALGVALPREARYKVADVPRRAVLRLMRGGR